MRTNLSGSGRGLANIFRCLPAGFPIYFDEITLLVVNCTTYLAVIFLLTAACAPPADQRLAGSAFRIEYDDTQESISVFRSDGTRPVLIQNAKTGTRPYIHPIMAPDGDGELTEYSPMHHKHQTGLYWGLKKANGRDYFMNWKEDYWQKVSADVLTDEGSRVKWRTVYNLLDENGVAVLEETQTWTFFEDEGRYVMDLTWEGTARVEVTMEKFYVGGLFLRMPWHEGVNGQVINSAGQYNTSAEGQRAIWCDVGIQVPGRTDLGHIAILDHPDNEGFPAAWRVDNELGVGPSRQIMGDWTIPENETEVIHYRLIAYTGDFLPEEIKRSWKEFICSDKPITNNQ